MRVSSEYSKYDFSTRRRPASWKGTYARRKGWPLEEVTVNLRHSKIHATDCAECETREGMLDRIERDIHFAGSLTNEQRFKLLEIANKCPVHRTLTLKIDIKRRAF